jgi:acyl transferase domain-containing protein
MEIEKPTKADYWCVHILNPVCFYQGMLQIKECSNTILEIGPDATLIGMSKAYINEPHKVISSVIQNNNNNYSSLVSLLAQLYSNNVGIKWNHVYEEYIASPISLPTYPWERKHYWVD